MSVVCHATLVAGQRRSPSYLGQAVLVPGALPTLPRWKALNGDAYLGYGGFAADYNNLSVRLHDEKRLALGVGDE